jgi:hypothetical protein
MDCANPPQGFAHFMIRRTSNRSFRIVFRARSRPVRCWFAKPGPVAGGALLLGALAVGRAAAQITPPAGAAFAAEIVAAQGPFGPAPYDAPEAVLGPPATEFFDPLGAWSGGSPVRRVKLVEPAYHLDPTQTRKLLLTLGEGAAVVIRFAEPIRDNPAHPYGVDLLVFGNAAFTAAGMVHDGTDLNTLRLSGGGFYEPLLVSVSPGYTGRPGEDPDRWETWAWYRYENGPYADTAFPTQAHHWDRARAAWTEALMDFTKPVNPALAGWFAPGAARTLTAAEAIALYEGAGGGTGFDLRESGFDAVRYVKLEGRPGFSGGEVDALAAVRPQRVGDSLTLVPENVQAGPFEQVIWGAEPAAAPALKVTFHALDGALRLNTGPLPAHEFPTGLPGTVRQAVALDTQPFFAEAPVAFVADLTLFLDASDAEDGRALGVWQRTGGGWAPALFAYEPDQRAVVLRGLTALTDLVLTRSQPPALEPALAADGPGVRFTPWPGWRHVLERSADLHAWEAVAEITPSDAAPVRLNDPKPPAARAFYRLRLERP